jgi:hypothetical protein
MMSAATAVMIVVKNLMKTHLLSESASNASLLYHILSNLSKVLQKALDICAIVCYDVIVTFVVDVKPHCTEKRNTRFATTGYFCVCRAFYGGELFCVSVKPLADNDVSDDVRYDSHDDGG